MSKAVTIRKKPHPAVRILTALACLVLSLFLVAASLLPPIVNCVSGLVDADNLIKIVNDMDFDATFNALDASPEISSDAKEVLKFVRTMTTTDYGHELINLYLSQIASQAKGEDTSIDITTDTLYNFMKSHFDDIKDTFLDKDAMAELEAQVDSGAITQEELDTKIDDAVKDVAEGFAAAIPDFADVIGTLGLTAGVVAAFVSKVFILTVLGIMAVFAVLIYVLKLWKRKGLVWLAVDFGIVAVLVGTFGFVFTSAGKTADIIADQILSFFAPITAPFLLFVGKRLLIVACVYLALVIICVLWKTFYSIRLKKAIAAQGAAPVEKKPEARPEDYAHVNLEQFKPAEPVTYEEVGEAPKSEEVPQYEEVGEAPKSEEVPQYEEVGEAPKVEEMPQYEEKKDDQQ